jgi:chromosome segregation ATPase
MLKEDQVIQITEEIAEEQAQIAAIKEAHEKATSEQSDLREQITIHEADIQTIRAEIQTIEKLRIHQADDYSRIQRITQPKAVMLEEDKKEKEIEALFDKQPTFWSSIGARIDHHQKLLDAGFEKSEPDLASDKLSIKFYELAVESNSFTPLAGALRSGAHNYKEFMRNLCVKQLAGGKLTAQEKRQRIQIIDNCLLSQEVEPHWA